MLDRDALDRHITDGRYSKSLLIVTCKECGTRMRVVSESEYGASEWSPGECGACLHPWDGDEEWDEDDGPDEDAAYDRWREDRDERLP